MSFSCIYPLALLLLLLLPVVWLITRMSVQHNQRRTLMQSPRTLLILGVRLLFSVCVILALAGTQLVRAVDDMTVVFLVDGSDSVTPAQRAWAVEYINRALAQRRNNDKAAIVLFGQNALVERIPAALDQLAQLTSTPIGSRTNIAEALQLGVALLPADTQKRVVLLSDGEENAGNARETARFVTVRDIPIDSVMLPTKTGDDVMVTALSAPDTAREGQSITLQAHIRSSIATSGNVQVFINNELIATQTIDIPEGTTTLPIAVPGSDAGFNRYEIHLEAVGDTHGVNNRGAAFTTVQGPPRVLLVASDASRATPLKTVLEAANGRVTVVAPHQVPADQVQLKTYAAVILVDVLEHDVPRRVIDALPTYVHDQGGTLAMIGGRESFGAGGWRRSPLAHVLPVQLERQDSQQRPDIGLVLVIDKSGSMSEMTDGSRTKLDLAKEAVYQATLALETNDQLGVITFDTQANWMLPVQPLPNLVTIQSILNQFAADGGTDIRSGIEPAANTLATLDAKVKHVILLTDGQAESNYANLIDAMKQNATTITVVSIGTDANPELEQIAARGGGRFYQVNNFADVPRIFLSETVLVIGRDIVEEQFTPVVGIPSPIVRPFHSLPPLYGYNVTQPRPTARNILLTPDGKPILAQWQYGLGRSIAWTSDLQGAWATEWIAWDKFNQFGSGLLDMLLPPQRAEGLSLSTHSDGDKAIIELTVTNNQQNSINKDITIHGRLLNPHDEAVTPSFVQVGVNRYRATVPVEDAGVYLAQVAVLDSTGQAIGAVSNGLVVAYSAEYSARGANPQLLADIATISNGDASPAPETLFTPNAQTVGVVQEIAMPLLWVALVLLPLDVALRRLLIRHSDVTALQTYIRTVPTRRAKHTLPGNTPATRASHTPSNMSDSDNTIARLQAAKKRAQRNKE